jgi:hypothetical protein
VSVIVCTAGALLPHASLIVSLSTRIGLLAVYFLGMWHSNVLSEEDRLLVRRWIASPRLALATLRA